MVFLLVSLWFPLFFNPILTNPGLFIGGVSISGFSGDSDHCWRGLQPPIIKKQGFVHQGLPFEPQNRSALILWMDEILHQPWKDDSPLDKYQRRTVSHGFQVVLKMDLVPSVSIKRGFVRPFPMVSKWCLEWIWSHQYL